MPPPNQSQPPVTCIVLNYNGWRDTITCVQSVLAQDYPNLHVLIVDNASTDGSVAQIRAAVPQSEILEATGNGGFASGNNLGIRSALASTASFIWLLNNDTVAPPGTLAKLVATAANTPRVGIVGTVLYHFDNPPRIQAWGGGSVSRVTGYSRHFVAPATLGRDSFLTFSSVLIRREVFEEVGLLDEGFFMYFEDADYSFRVRNAGWSLAVASDTAVLHREGSNSGLRSNPRGDRIVTASGIRFLLRHGRHRWLAPILYVVSRLAKRVLRLNPAGVRGVLQGLRDWKRGTPAAFLTEGRP